MSVASLYDREKQYERDVRNFWMLLLISIICAPLFSLAMSFFLKFAYEQLGYTTGAGKCVQFDPIQLAFLATLFEFTIFFSLFLGYKSNLSNNRKLIEIFKILGLQNAKWVDDTLVYLYRDTFIIGLFSSARIYFVKLLRYRFISEGKISLPTYTFNLECIRFKVGIAYFSHKNVTIRDSFGNYLEGEACILIIPMETMEAILKEYSHTSDGLKKEILDEAIRILNEKCLESIEKKQKPNLLSYLKDSITKQVHDIKKHLFQQ